MSHSLSMLRTMLQDELFVRRGQSMEPTAYALRLAEPVRRVLAEAQEALMTRTRFDMLSEQRVFRIAVAGYLATTILPDLFAGIRAVAPSVRLAVREASQHTISDMLKHRRSEIGIGCFELKQSWINQETLFRESYVCCFNSKLVKTGSSVDSENYLKLPHVAVTAREESPFGCLERAFAELGKKPNVVMSVSNCFTAATIAARTPVLATLPATVATEYAALLGLTISPLPFDMEIHPISMVWDSRMDGDGSAKWLRNKIKEVVKKLGAETFSRGVTDSQRQRPRSSVGSDCLGT